MASRNVGCFLRLVIVKKKYFFTGIFTERKGGVTGQAFRARIMKFKSLQMRFLSSFEGAKVSHLLKSMRFVSVTKRGSN